MLTSLVFFAYHLYRARSNYAASDSGKKFDSEIAQNINIESSKIRHLESLNREVKTLHSPQQLDSHSRLLQKHHQEEQSDQYFWKMQGPIE